MRRTEGVVIGIVKEIDASLGRVKVEFPWLQASYRSAWAPVATPLTGKGRGAFIMPEVDDEALVAFEHGDFEHPFVVGFLWNGVDTPPSADIDASVRRLRTVSGHVVEFDDRGGQERILIKTKGGHLIEMKDTPPAHVDIKTAGGQEVKLSDSPASVAINTTGQNAVTISDAPPSVTIKTSTGAEVNLGVAGISVSAPSGIVNVNCAMASLTSSSILNVNAPLAQFSGIVQATTVIATSVVSSTYTPGIGNLFGL